MARGVVAALHLVLHQLELCMQLQPLPVVHTVITVKDKVVRAMVHGLDHILFHHHHLPLLEQVKLQQV